MIDKLKRPSREERLPADPASVEAMTGKLVAFSRSIIASTDCYYRAVELRPDFAKTHSNLGDALKELGDFRGAEDAHRAALRHEPRFAPAYYKLAELLGAKLPESDLAAQRRLLADGELIDGELTDGQRLFLRFGLAQVAQHGDYLGEITWHAQWKATRWLTAGSGIGRPTIGA
jgi:tetratricopeptide (TPR) repeat protein